MPPGQGAPPVLPDAPEQASQSACAFIAVLSSLCGGFCPPFLTPDSQDHQNHPSSSLSYIPWADSAAADGPARPRLFLKFSGGSLQLGIIRDAVRGLVLLLSYLLSEFIVLKAFREIKKKKQTLLLPSCSARDSAEEL